MNLDDKDKAALAALADFEITGESAVIAGEMEAVITRSSSDGYRLILRIPRGEELDVQPIRGRLLKELGVEGGENA